MNQIHLQNAKRYLKETHERAYCDSLARKFQPNFRHNVAKFFAKLAVRLGGNPSAQPTELPSLKG
jgi:hypothetical protein